MKVSRDQAAENRDRIITVAGRLLRERGVDGIGVDAIMQAAGLTHGGFYKSFASKDALVAEACERVMTESAAKGATVGSGSEEDLRKWVKSYLSLAHCGAIGDGCVFAALATEAGRRPGPLRRVFTNGLADAVKRLAQCIPGHPANRRRRALVTMASLVGTIVLARATDDEDMRAELLSATAAMLLDPER